MNLGQLVTLVNRARSLEALFPGAFRETKHDHYKDFGFPTSLEFVNLYHMFRRNSLAKAAVSKTVMKTWQSHPELWENEDPDESTLERDIRVRFADLRLWQAFAECDRRMLVGGYSGAILRLADGKRFDQPVETVGGGLAGLVEVIPAWRGQLRVQSWNTDETSPDYGQPTLFSFNEAELPDAISTETRTRSLTIHPDRVIIWSADGTVNCISDLEAGYNDLMTIEKVVGAGGEGFWKNAKSAPILQVDKEANIADIAKTMGVEPSAVADAMNSQIEDWQKGFDKLLMIQGMEAKTLGVNLPVPEHFFGAALQCFAASFSIPLKILVGNQTGQRASEEDAQEWNQTNMSRRTSVLLPTINAFVQRMERFKILPEMDWTINWADLTEASMKEKIERAEKMATINSKMPTEPPFTDDEVRAVLGYLPNAIPRQTESDQ